MQVEFLNKEIFTGAEVLKCDYDSVLFTLSLDNKYDELYTALTNPTSVSEINFIDESTGEIAETITGYGVTTKIETLPEENCYTIQLERVSMRQQLLSLQAENEIIKKTIAELQAMIPKTQTE